MKTIIFFALIAVAVNFFIGCDGGNLFLNWGYNISGNKVLYKNAFPNGTIEIPNADAKTFKIIYQPATANYAANSDYATDKNYAYYGGNVIVGSHSGSFKLLSHDFAKDKNQCYYHGKTIPNADPSSFTIKDETFSVDKNNVYKADALLDNTASVFESYDSGLVVHTQHTVSVLDAMIPVSTNASFKYIGFGYFAINDQVYFHDKPMNGVSTTTFKPFNQSFSLTAKHVYYEGEIMENADPASFQLLGTPYSKDDKHVFFREKTITGADPNSFEILNIDLKCTRDKNAAYKEDMRIKNTTVADLSNKSKCIQCSWDSIHFEGK